MSLEVAITVSIGRFRLDAEFSAPPGITALFGPSGAGKTVTLRAVAGLRRPDQGTIRMNGRTLFDSGATVDVPTRSRRIGFVFQQSALLPHLSVGGNVGYGLHGWPKGEREERISELLELVGLADERGRRPSGLSGGEQQRVALARALAPRPQLLLLDEPFAALDGRVRRRLREELRALHDATGVPMVLVTHDLAEVRQLAGWLVVYGRGRVLASGPAAQLLGDPPHPAVQEALGEQ